MVSYDCVELGLGMNYDGSVVCADRFRDLLRDDGDEPKRLLKRDGLLGHYSRVSHLKHYTLHVTRGRSAGTLLTGESPKTLHTT